MKPKLIIMVNPLRLNERLCQAFLTANIKILALYTWSTAQQSYFQIDKKYFIFNELLTLDLEKDLKKIQELIKNYDLIAVLPAVEVDLDYAEKIAYALRPELANNPKDSYLRYKKYEMNEALKQAGLNAISQMRFPISETLHDIAPLTFPVVVKPSFQSGGSVGVKICQDMDETQAHLLALRQTNDPFGKKIESEIIIQDKIEGVEYFSDSVTWKDQHYITAIFKYMKTEIAGLPIYRYIDFLNPENQLWPLCYDYIVETLDTLQVHHGFAHTEFIVTDQEQPFLIEINPRLSGIGGEINRLCKLVTGYDQSDIYIQLINNEITIKTMAEKYKTQHLHGRMVLLFAWENMQFKGFKQEIFEKLQSAQHVFRQFKPEGTLLAPPENLLDVVVSVNLIDDDMEKIIADTNYLQRLEKAGELFHG